MLCIKHILVDRSHSRAVADAERIGERGAAGGVADGMVFGPADHDTYGSGIDGVGAVVLDVRERPIARSALRGMDGPHSAGLDVAVGEVVEVERLSALMSARDGYAAARGVDRAHLDGMCLEPIGTTAVAG